MGPEDLELRNHVYRRFVELGRAPTSSELADELARPYDEVIAGLQRLHEFHAVVLEPDQPEIRMANPFSAVSTPHRVWTDDRLWSANCAWEAFGIPAALGVDGHVSSSCPDCGEAIEIDVVGQRPVPDDAVVHLLVPAAQWWDDIVFT
ncbi:MAG: organomercurial lyase [Actinomycetota bacterium]|nr:organomercurial lyase [Actinomycetota bacterium]